MLSFRSVLEHTCAALPLSLSHVTHPFIQNIGRERAREAMVSISIATDQSTLVKRRAGDSTARSENAALYTGSSFGKHTRVLFVSWSLMTHRCPIYWVVGALAT
eukprot:sb/3478028/